MFLIQELGGNIKQHVSTMGEHFKLRKIRPLTNLAFQKENTLCLLNFSLSSKTKLKNQTGFWFMKQNFKQTNSRFQEQLHYPCSTSHFFLHILPQSSFVEQRILENLKLILLQFSSPIENKFLLQILWPCNMKASVVISRISVFTEIMKRYSQNRIYTLCSPLFQIYVTHLVY